MNFRQVHIDFHTSEKIEGIGSRFDKKQFQNALKKGHVNSVTVFSKCHHGWSYHPTKANEMHPHLNFDLFGAQIEAAREIGVNVVGYISAGLDEKYAVLHPESLARAKDETIQRTPNFRQAGYHLICMNSPYLAVLVEQVKEMCAAYDVSGVFLDIVRPVKCYCQNCVRRMRKEGLDPMNEDDVQRFAHKTYLRYTETIRRAVDEINPALTVFHNGGGTPRGKRDVILANSHIEIESLPTGGWGYDNLPMTSRYVQPMELDFLGMTGKFHLSWGEFGGYKHENALIYETSLAVANGGKCSIGDQLHPLGLMDERTYALIGAAYAEIEKKEPWLDRVRGVAEIAVLSFDAWLVRHPALAASKCRKTSDVGALRILLEGHYLFDIVDEEADLTRYKLLILPDGVMIDEELKPKLDAFLAAGGKLLASANSALSMPTDGKSPAFAYKLGARFIAPRTISPIYLRATEPRQGEDAAGYVLYSPSVRAEADPRGEMIAYINEPYFERTAEHFCSHFHAPESPLASGVGVTAGEDGMYIACEIFREYAEVGSLIAKQTVTDAIDRLLGEAKLLQTALPAQAIVTLMEQTEQTREILHLLYAPRAAKGASKIEVIEDCVPLYRVPISLSERGRRVKRIYTVPDGVEIAYSHTDHGRIEFTVPEISIHAMVVIEYEQEEKS